MKRRAGPRAAARPVSRIGTRLALAVAVSACGADSGGAADAGPGPAPDPPIGGTAVVGVAAAATTPFPPLAAAALDFELGSELYLGLNYGEWRDGHLEFLPGHELGLARDWTVDLERARIEYHLDTRRRWSDGRPVRARDVQFTYELLADTSLALPLSGTTERIDSVVVVDDSTVVFHFDAAYPGMLFDTGVGILPAHVYGGVPHGELRGRPRSGETLVVSGPFRVAEWAPSSRIVLARNDASTAPARLDRLVVEVLPEESTRAARLRGGSLDVAQINSFREARRLAGGDGIRLLRIPQRGYDYVAWNPAADPALADADVRRALSLAIDRESAIEALDMSGFAEPAWGPYGSLFAGYRPPPPDDPLHDPARARALLEAAGWTDADGDGVREREGTPLHFVLEVPSGNERREDAAELIRTSLGEVGVEIQIRPVEFNALFGRMLGEEYEAALMGWQIALDPDIGDFWLPSSPLDVTGLDDPTVEATIAEARSRPTREAAVDAWRRAAARIAELHPYAFLWYFDLPLAVGPRIHGVEVDVSGWGPGAYRWWVEPRAPEP